MGGGFKMTGIINISEAASLGIHGLIFMTKNKDKYLNVKEIAEALDVSSAHLAKILQKLVKFGILKSTRGPNGGFDFAKSLSSITLLDVYISIEGPLPENYCLMKKNECPFKKCVLGNFIEKTNREFFDFLKSAKLSDLIERK